MDHAEHDKGMEGAVFARALRLPIEAIDNPILIDALAFWRRLALTGIPSRRAIDPVMLGGKLLPYIFLVDVHAVEPRFVYRLSGTAIEEEFGPLRGKSLDGLNLGGAQLAIREQYDNAVAERGPVYGIHDFVTRDNKHRAYRRVVMPLTTDGSEIDCLFGAAIFPGKWPASPG